MSTRQTLQITQEKLKEMLHYNPETGVFTWLKGRTGSAKAGSRAGTKDDKGYILIRFSGVLYKAHRLAWLYMTGAWPGKEIDHKNGIKDDNRWLNLREATHAENQKNMPAYSNNTSGFKGVWWHKGAQKWAAHCSIDRKRKHLGLFDTPEEASAVYEAFAKATFGEFYREIKRGSTDEHKTNPHAARTRGTASA